MLKASFVIPVYNDAPYIAEAIDSCLLQTESKIEVVVVDDGSTDLTAEIVNWFIVHDARVRYISLKENKGRSAARNAGNAAALAPVVFVLDSDDIAHRKRVQWTLQYFKQHPDVAVAYGDYELIDGLGQRGNLVKCDQVDWKRAQETKFNGMGHSTMAFRKYVTIKVQYTGGDYSKMGIDDWKWQVDAHKAGYKFGYLNKTLGQYRVFDKTRDEKTILVLKEAALK